MPSDEAAPFNQMYEELGDGRRAALTDTERVSVQSAFDRYGVASRRLSRTRFMRMRLPDPIPTGLCSADTTFCGRR
jgi:hypothetical protein